jgi:hypothetical protein
MTRHFRVPVFLESHPDSHRFVPSAQWCVATRNEQMSSELLERFPDGTFENAVRYVIERCRISDGHAMVRANSAPASCRQTKRMTT